MKPQFLRTLTGLCIGILLSVGSLYAQITPISISYGPPAIVNFQQLANYEVLHPQKAHRVIEQGEDKDKNFKFIPQRVPSSAVTFPVTSSSTGSRATSPAPIVSFNGIMDHDSLIPPDIELAAGPTYVLQTTNQQFSIYTKSGTLQSRITITSLLASSGGSGFFDPHVEYDANNGRFIIALDGTYSNGDGGIFIAVSQTSDPTGNWYIYSFDGIGNKTDFLDYPLLGFNSNWVVVTANDFIKGSSPVYGKVFVLNRASLYGGTQGTVTSFTDQTAFSLCPAQTNDNSQATEYIVQDYNGNSGGSGYMQLCTITGAAGSPVFTAGSIIGVTSPWSETATGAKQLGSSNTIEEGDTRVSYAVYTNGSLWFSHTVFLPATKPTYSGVDWWQVNPSTPSVLQYGRLATSGVFNYYSSINVNSNGDALLGYSVSSTSQYASSAYAFHAASDAANTMESGYVYKGGVAGYYKTYNSGRNRWGDFSGTAVDPNNNSFWNSNEWANTSNNWATQIANIAASNTTPCNAPTSMGTTAISNASATFNWTGPSGASSYNVQYRQVGTTAWSVGTSSTNSYTAINLTPGTNYEWQVQTLCTGGGSSAFTSSTDFLTTGTAPCNTPTGMATNSITSTSATLAWTAVSGAASYNIQYRVIGAATWTIASSLTASYPLSGLTPSTNYEWQVQTVCSGTNTSSFTSSTDFSTPSNTITYCASKGSTTFEYINNITLGTINNTSGNNNGYGNYTNLSTSLTAGTTYAIKLTPGFNGSSYTEYWTVYIDYNQDGVLNSSGETVLEIRSTGTAAISGSFTVPKTAKNGSTRLRVQMHYGGYSTNPCATLNYGEVEDYTVAISNGTGAPVTNNDAINTMIDVNSTDINSAVLYPNPTNNIVMVHYNVASTGDVMVQVLSVTGQVMYTINPANNTQDVQLNVANLPAGIYFVRTIVGNNKVIVSKLVKE